MLPKKRGKRLPLKVRSVVDLHDFHSKWDKISVLLVRTSNKGALRFFAEVHSEDVAGAFGLSKREPDEPWAKYKASLLPALQLLKQGQSIDADNAKKKKGRR